MLAKILALLAGVQNSVAVSHHYVDLDSCNIVLMTHPFTAQLLHYLLEHLYAQLRLQKGYAPISDHLVA